MKPPGTVVMRPGRPTGLRSAVELAQGKPHGLRIRYMGGCRCLPCRAANSRYECDRAAARRRGEGGQIVLAHRARLHLHKLSAAGVGRRTVSELAGVGKTVIAEIKSGRASWIRATTERAIMAVACKAAPPATKVDARPTWRLIERLLEEGYTKGFIAQQLGAKRPALQLQRDRVTKANALKVERIFQRLTT